MKSISTLSQVYELSRLKCEEDQWQLAICMIAKDLSTSECRSIVNLVLSQELTVEEALRLVAGVRFRQIMPPVLLIPFSVDLWFDLTRTAWSRGKNWEDLCYQFILEGLSVNINDVAERLESLAASLRKAGQNNPQ